MNIFNKLISLVRFNNNKADYHNLNKWKSEAEGSLANLKHGHFSIEKAVDRMQDYKQFDKAKAYKAITGEDLYIGRIVSIRRVAIASVAAIALLVGGFFIFKANTDFQSQVIASNTLKEVTLKDNSVVILDMASTLTTKGDRKVALSGRAFFHVQSTPEKANFVIELYKGKVTVLGTKFSINTNASTNDISVEEGKVRYEYEDKNIILTAGQSVALINNKLAASNNSANVFSWKSQILEFIDAPVEQAISDISKHYNVTIEIEKSVRMQKTCLLTTKIKNESADQFMKELKSLFGINYYKKGSGFVITSIRC